jgi:hypothetical protein
LNVRKQQNLKKINEMLKEYNNKNNGSEMDLESDSISEYNKQFMTP